MAPEKRKAALDERPRKKAKSTDPSVPSKTTKPKRDSKDDLRERNVAQRSVLQQEEKSFPRGGASVLTPLEHKQIKAQAERDVLFEQQKGDESKEEGEDGELDHAGARPKKKTKGRKRDTEKQEKTEKSNVRISGLRYKDLVPGAGVLGCVTAITEKDVALALANNLTGYIPITSISERLNSRIEEIVEAEGDDDGLSLKQLFHLGQWLRAVVTSTTSDVGADVEKKKRHIELSIDPRHVNNALNSEQTVVNSMISAVVRSVEDHGVVMDLGLRDADVRGFISKKELGAAFKLDEMQEGQVMMCLVTGKGSNGKVLKLSPDASRFSVLTGTKDSPEIKVAPTVDALQSGMAVEILVTDASANGVVGKIMGMLDVTADVVHSGSAFSASDMAKRYKPGTKTKARILWTIPADDGSRRIGISLLEYPLLLPAPPSKLAQATTAKQREQIAECQQAISDSSYINETTVKHVQPERGLFLDFKSPSGSTSRAFVHISQVTDGRIDSLSSSTGSYMLGSTHKARVLSYNPVDCLYYVSLRQSTLDQPFLRVEDLNVGDVVKGTIEKLMLGAKGVSGVLVKLSESVNGLVPEMHLSDTQLQHPERKFKEGFPVRCRILSVDLEKRHVRLTLKRSLVNDEDAMPIWKDYSDLKPEMESKGTIVNLLSNGAAVQFFGNVRAWLPVAEMSDTYIESPQKYFRTGQTINVRILSVDAHKQEMKVSSKTPTAFGPEQQKAWDLLSPAETVTGTVSAKSAEDVTIQVENGLKGILRAGHLNDGSTDDTDKAMSRIRLGQKMSSLVVLHKMERNHHLFLTKKPSLTEDATAKILIRSFDDIKEGMKVRGFVRNVTDDGVYIEFAGDIVGLMPRSQVAAELLARPSFGFIKDQSIAAVIISVDSARERFTLSMRAEAREVGEAARSRSSQNGLLTIAHAVDPSITSLADLTMGKVTKARIASVKATQMNVRLADNVQGRIDISEVFDSWDEITNRKAPLQKFKANEVLDVKILGVHDARNHRFLPISHRQSSAPVFELSAKRSRIDKQAEEGLTMGSIKPESTHVAFVNNHGDRCVWVNISPNVRGRVALMDLSDDPGHLQNLAKHFPMGSALQTRVKNVDAVTNRLDLSATSNRAEDVLTLESMSPGMILAGRVTKITERSINVQLSDNLAAPVPLVEMSDDFDQPNLGQYNKNDIVRVCVLDIDRPNKKIFLSLRPSRVLSSSLPVRDPQITSFSQLKPGSVIRGFVKHVADKGVYVALGSRVDAYVRIADLSDQYIKDWKSIVEIDQLVSGRLISVDVGGKSALLSLKASHVDDNYIPLLSIADLKVGMVITGKIRKVEDFGAFIDIDKTQPRLSGLCHRSEVAAKRVEDVRKIYAEGDVVKAKVLNVDVNARKISLGLKASYFDDEVDDGAEEDDEGGVDVDIDPGDGEDVDMTRNIDVMDQLDSEDDSQESVDDSVQADEENSAAPSAGLQTSGFDWSGTSLRPAEQEPMSDTEAETSVSKKRKRSRPEIKMDLTGELDKHGPRSVNDFERQLLGQPNDSGLWIQYMAFQLQLMEVQKARELAERALRTIHIRETEEKGNIWIAWLNLEVEYGDDDSVEEVFGQARQMQDPLEMHEKLASIYIDSGKPDKADAVFERIVANKAFRASPDVWLNDATFLMDTLKAPARARALLPKALQSVPTNEHRLLTAKFAGLEFRSAQGDAERGRTIFEGLVSEWPKWTSGWDMFVDLERSKLAQAKSGDAKEEAREKVRALFERMAAQKIKKRRAKFVFKRWLDFEEAEGNAKTIARVKALAAEYVKRQQAGEEDIEE